MTREQEKFGRVAALNFVPKILDVGELESDTGSVYYTILTLLPGDDFVNVYQGTTIAQQKQLGQDITTIFIPKIYYLIKGSFRE